MTTPADTPPEPLSIETHCLLCGDRWGTHDQAACDAKMTAWQPAGLLAALRAGESPTGINPPVRMAWHDPAPSLAEKARADGEVGFLVTGDRCDRCGDANYDEQTRVCPSCTHPTHPASHQPLLDAVEVPPAEYAAMLAVVQAARAYALAWAAYSTLGGDAIKIRLAKAEAHQALLDATYAAVEALPDEEAAP